MTEQVENRELLGKDPAVEMLASLERNAAGVVNRPWCQVVKEIMQATGAIIRDNAALAVDEQSKMFLLPTSAFALAVYRVLSGIIGDRDRVIDILARSVAGQMSAEAYVARRYGVTQDAPEQAFEMCRVNFKRIGEEQYGRSFVFDQDTSGDTDFCISVRKCYWKDFLSANGAIELLLPVSCMQDEMWIEELNKPKYRMTVRRSPTMAQGNDACRVYFSKRK